jgi:hypothetical protein
MSGFRSLGDIAPLPIWPGILARVVEGKDITFAIVELDAGAVAARQPAHERTTRHCPPGTMRFDIGGEVRDLRPGDTYEIPSNVWHEATAGPDGAVGDRRLRADSRRLASLRGGRETNADLALGQCLSSVCYVLRCWDAERVDGSWR